MRNRLIAILLLVLLSTFVVAQKSAPVPPPIPPIEVPGAPDPLAGRFDANHYSNQYFRMQLELPSEWFPSTTWMVPAGGSKRQMQDAAYWRDFHRQHHLLFIALNRSEMDPRRFWAPPPSGIATAPTAPILGGHEHEEIDVRALTVEAADLIPIRQAEIDLIRGAAGTMDFRLTELPVIYSGVAFTRVDYRTQGSDVDKIFHTALFAIRNGSILSFRFQCPRHQKRLQQVVDAVMQSVRFDNTPPPSAPAPAKPAPTPKP